MGDIDQHLLVWIIIAVVAAGLEAMTTAFVALYIALGAVAAAIVAGQGGDVEWQLLAFVVTGVILLLATRPVLKRWLETPEIPTNVYDLSGRRGVVTIAIDNDANTGQIRVGTEYWTARIEEAAGTAPPVIDAGAKVLVTSVNGVTALVSPFVVTDDVGLVDGEPPAQ